MLKSNERTYTLWVCCKLWFFHDLLGGVLLPFGQYATGTTAANVWMFNESKFLPIIEVALDGTRLLFAERPMSSGTAGGCETSSGLDVNCVCLGHVKGWWGKIESAWLKQEVELKRMTRRQR
jgi:hypothetical protein